MMLNKLKIFFILIAVFHCIINPSYAEDYRTDTLAEIPNVIILTISGVSNEHTIDDPTHQYMPGLFNKLAQKGFLYTNLIEASYEFHMPAVQAINSGINYNSFHLNLEVPSLFQYIIKQGILPKEKVWSIGHWTKEDFLFQTDEYDETTFPNYIILAFMSYSANANFVNKAELLYFLKEQERLSKHSYASWPQWALSARVFHKITKRIFSDSKPKFMHYLLNMPEAAHYGSYAEYVQSITETDEHIIDIWNTITKDPYYIGNTYLFVVVDHQRDIYYMDHCESWFTPERNVWLYVYGPDIKANSSSAEPIYHIDIFSTIAEIYGLNTHKTQGRALKSCFVTAMPDKDSTLHAATN